MRLLRVAGICGFLYWFCVASSAFGQNARLKMDHLDKLASKATEVTDVSLDGPLLKLASKFLSEKESEEAEIKDLIAGVKGVYVKTFEFEEGKAYSPADLDSIREQLRAPGWSRIVNVQNRSDGEDVEIYVMNEGEQVSGLAIITAEPEELTVVNIVGPVSLDRLSKLGGHLGIPPVDLKLPADKAPAK